MNTLLGLYGVDMIGITNFFTKKQEIKLAKLKDTGDRKAFNKLVKSIMPLVIRIAKTYSCPGLQTIDFVQEGNMGLIRAVERYDWKKEIRLSSYSAFWIRSYIRHYIDKYRLVVRVPSNAVVGAREIKKLQHQYPGKSFSILEIAEELDISKELAKAYFAVLVPSISLNSPIGHNSYEKSDTFLDKVSREDFNIINSLIDEQRQKAVCILLTSLSEQDARLIKLRFGIDMPESYTLAEIGSMLEEARTGESVRQAINKILKKLKFIIQKNQT